MTLWVYQMEKETFAADSKLFPALDLLERQTFPCCHSLEKFQARSLPDQTNELRSVSGNPEATAYKIHFHLLDA